MEGEESLRKFSPQVLVKDVAGRSAVSLLPHIILFHGTSDCSMPCAERWVKVKQLTSLDFLSCSLVGLYLYSGYWYELTQSKIAVKLSLTIYNSVVLKRICSYMKERRILIYFFR
jgi:hypothetical protein